MNGIVATVVLLVLVAGIAIAFSNPITIYGLTIYPNFWSGVVIGVIGFVTLALGFAFGGKDRKEVEDEILTEAYGEEEGEKERTKFQRKEKVEDPVEILKLGLAKGEISKEEYEELRRRIED
jgi:uncharacterized membrane protein